MLPPNVNETDIIPLEGTKPQPTADETQDIIRDLAKLEPADYERQRKDKAAFLRFRPSVLDSEVKKARERKKVSPGEPATISPAVK